VKRSFYILLVVGLISALLGWGLAWKRTSDRINATTAAAVLAKQAEAKRIADHVALLVHSADEAVLSFAVAGSAKDVHITDPVWISRLADAISQSFCTPTSHGLWISVPVIKLYRSGKPVVELMMLGNILCVFDAEHLHDFVIEQKSAATISALVHEKLLPSG